MDGIFIRYETHGASNLLTLLSAVVNTSILHGGDACKMIASENAVEVALNLDELRDEDGVNVTRFMTELVVGEYTADWPSAKVETILYCTPSAKTLVQRRSSEVLCIACVAPDHEYNQYTVMELVPIAQRLFGACDFRMDLEAKTLTVRVPDAEVWSSRNVKTFVDKAKANVDSVEFGWDDGTQFWLRLEPAEKWKGRGTTWWGGRGSGSGDDGGSFCNPEHM